MIPQKKRTYGRIRAINTSKDCGTVRCENGYDLFLHFRNAYLAQSGEKCELMINQEISFLLDKEKGRKIATDIVVYEDSTQPKSEEEKYYDPNEEKYVVEPVATAAYSDEEGGWDNLAEPSPLEDYLDKPGTP